MLGVSTSAWKELWNTPPAAAWEPMGHGVVRIAARYLVILVRADLGDTRARTEARLLEDCLGLSPLAMLRLHWQITPDTTGQS